MLESFEKALLQSNKYKELFQFEYYQPENEGFQISAIMPSDGSISGVKSLGSGYSQYYDEYGVWYPDWFEFDVTQTYLVDANSSATPTMV